ncbi:MAG TPA: ABC transporter permease [Candidatus Faecousia faecipullorum]|nr:ABC transporter permease [Candidatus Faecousia faecipullorum]
MAKYITKRVLRSLITMFFIVTILFTLLRFMPVEGYFESYDKMTPTQIQVQLNALGLTDPLPKQLLRFYNQLIHGDLGVSNVYRKGVEITTIIKEKAPISMALGLAAMAISMAVGLPLGILMARSTRTKYKIGDKLGTVFIVLIQAMPSAVYHILIQFAGSQTHIGKDILGLPMLYDAANLKSIILPLISLSIGNIAYYAMWLRRYMVDESNKDYIRLARAKGVPSGAISRKHIFRNAFVPMVQYIPNSILLTLVGSLYVESLYSVPGMGGLLVTAIKRQDNTLVQALVLIYAILSILGLLFGDLLMGIVDPRISFAKKEGSR